MALSHWINSNVVGCHLNKSKISFKICTFWVSSLHHLHQFGGLHDENIREIFLLWLSFLCHGPCTSPNSNECGIQTKSFMFHSNPPPPSQSGHGRSVFERQCRPKATQCSSPRTLELGQFSKNYIWVRLQMHFGTSHWYILRFWILINVFLKVASVLYSLPERLYSMSPPTAFRFNYTFIKPSILIIKLVLSQPILDVYVYFLSTFSHLALFKGIPCFLEHMLL